MSKPSQIRGRESDFAAINTVASLCARTVELADDVLSTEPWTREGSDARRLFRVTIRQMEMRADSSRDPLLIAVV
jgi:hypothetical protein